MALLLPFMKDDFRLDFRLIRYPVLILSFALIHGCGIESTRQYTAPPAEEMLENSPMVKGQVAPPEHIRSIQLYRNDQKASIPAFKLGGDDRITLRFDELGSSPRLFRVRVRHRNSDWSDSRLAPGFFLSGHREDLISRGQPANVQRPDYVHYTYRFPNDEMQLTMSGNYLLQVLDYETSQIVFSMPFFVYEEEGDIQIDLERVFGMNARYRLHHQPFSRYRYPSSVISPFSDLSTWYVQNRFWGRARKADVQDISEAGVYATHLSRPQSFIGVYEFRPLNLRRYDDPRPGVIDIRSETTPPQVTLRRDVVNLDVTPATRAPAIHGRPRDDRNARYVDVRFELEIPEREATDLPIYIYGPFNNWMISDQNRMEYRASTNSYTGRAIIKEGEYDYKYAVVEDRRIDDLRLDDMFASTRQEYTVLVYFRDPVLQAERLMNMNSSFSY
ncbi:DUF5103 domain-containing protein [Balneolales bacterium ANBcel1]|nr:DUF5103 domain-containing protein [Balneolales bacterium ANBcel1]